MFKYLKSCIGTCVKATIGSVLLALLGSIVLALLQVGMKLYWLLYVFMGGN